MLNITFSDFKYSSLLIKRTKVFIYLCAFGYLLGYLLDILLAGLAINITSLAETHEELQNMQKLLIIGSFVLLSGFKIITLLGAVILAWKSVYRLNYNARALGSENMKFTPISSIIWANIPIVGIWKCYQIMKELFYVSSDTKDANNNKTNDRLCRFYLFSNIFLHFFFIYNIYATISIKQDDLSVFSLPYITNIGEQISFLMMLILCSLIINRIQRMQSEKQKIAYLTKEV